MLAAADVVKALKMVGINAVHIKMRGRGGEQGKRLTPINVSCDDYQLFL